MMMLNCREASQLTSESLDHPLSWSKRFALRFHLSMCKYCKRYARQVRFIHQIVDLGRDELEEAWDASGIQMPEDAKKRIREALH